MSSSKNLAKVGVVPEAKLQVAVVTLLRFLLGDRAIVAHVPNGGRRDPREASHLQAQGVYPGFADVIILAGGRAYLMELKTTVGRQSANQVDFERRCREVGIPYVVVRSQGEARDALLAWGLVRDRQVPKQTERRVSVGMEDGSVGEDRAQCAAFEVENPGEGDGALC